MINSPGRHGHAAMSAAGDRRARELEHLKLALATFALQLDAFEVHAKEALQIAAKTNGALGRPPASLRKDRGIVGQ